MLEVSADPDFRFLSKLISIAALFRWIEFRVWGPEVWDVGVRVQRLGLGVFMVHSLQFEASVFRFCRLASLICGRSSRLRQGLRVLGLRE